MLRAPIWITSATSATSATSRTSISSVTIGRPVRSFASCEQLQALEPEALERVRRGPRLVGAAAQHLGAGLGDDVGRPRASARGSRPCRGRRSAAKLSPPTVHAADLEAPIARPCGTARSASLYGFRIGTRWSTPARALEPERLDAVAVADRADHGQELAAWRCGPSSRPPRLARRRRRSAPRSPRVSSRSSFEFVAFLRKAGPEIRVCAGGIRARVDRDRRPAKTLRREEGCASASESTGRIDA